LSAAGKAFAKLAPFKYPARVHLRTQKPPQYTNYRDYKPYLQNEFGGRCVYCRKFDLDQDSSAFHVEHYRPKARELFPQFETVYANLFYSCAACNRWKKSYWHEDSKKRILNPCDYVMSQHMQFIQEKVDHHTDQGELNIDFLRLNNPESLAYRKRQQDLTFRLIQGLVRLKGTKVREELDWIDFAVSKIAELTNETADKIRLVCKV
jgi:uncharacterized protein (TIGR02646 family)